MRRQRRLPALPGRRVQPGAERARDGASARRAAVPVPAPDLHRGTERGGRDHTLAVGHRAPAGLSTDRSDQADSLLRRGRHVPQRLRRGWRRALYLACLVNRAGDLHLSVYGNRKERRTSGVHLQDHDVGRAKAFWTCAAQLSVGKNLKSRASRDLQS